MKGKVLYAIYAVVVVLATTSASASLRRSLTGDKDTFRP